MGISQNEMHGTPTSQNTQERDASRGSKRKHCGYHSEVVEVFRNAMDFANDQVKSIVEC